MSETNNNNKPKINMPRFNLSWLYVIIAMSFGILYFSNQEGGIDKQITYTEFKDMVNKGYANKIIAYDNNTVEMFIKPEYIKDVFKNDYKRVGRSPSLSVEIGSIESFRKRVILQARSVTRKNVTISALCFGISLLSYS